MIPDVFNTRRSGQTESPRLGGSIPTEGSLTQELLGGSLSPKPGVHGGAPDVVVERRHAHRGEGAGRERGVVVELDVQKFALDRPAVAHRVFGAGAHGPPAAAIALLMAGTDWPRSVGREDPFRGVDLGPRTAAGGVHHGPVPDGPAESGARGPD